MVTKAIDTEKDSQEMQTRLQKREAGVMEMLQFYERVEAVYSSAAKALEETYISRTSSSTNLG